MINLAAFTAALVTVAFLAIWFTATRWMAILAFAALAMSYPWIAFVIVGVAIWSFFYFKVLDQRKKP